jgi:hypothetical protein
MLVVAESFVALRCSKDERLMLLPRLPRYGAVLCNARAASGVGKSQTGEDHTAHHSFDNMQRQSNRRAGRRENEGSLMRQRHQVFWSRSERGRDMREIAPSAPRCICYCVLHRCLLRNERDMAIWRCGAGSRGGATGPSSGAERARDIGT